MLIFLDIDFVDVARDPRGDSPRGRAQIRIVGRNHEPSEEKPPDAEYQPNDGQHSAADQKAPAHFWVKRLAPGRRGAGRRLLRRARRWRIAAHGTGSDKCLPSGTNMFADWKDFCQAMRHDEARREKLSETPAQERRLRARR